MTGKGGSKSLGSRMGQGGGDGVSATRRRGGGRVIGGGGGGSGTTRELTALIFAAFAFSLTTVLLSSPSISRSLAALDGMDVLGIGGEGGGGMRTMTNDAADRMLLSAHPTPPRRSVSDVITWMLSETDRDVDTQHAGLSRLDDSPYAPLEFPPGTLGMDHAHSLRHCYADPNIYANHLRERGDGGRVRVSYSDRHDLAYVMLPKSGSSTARHVLQNEFDASEVSISLRPEDFYGQKEEGGGKGGTNEGKNTTVITFVRDPLSRFYSQYDESYVRTAPWQKNNNPYYVDPNNDPTDAQRGKPHPFPYLYEGLKSYDDYEDVYCPMKGRKSRKECKRERTREDGTLARRFERFVSDYDGLDPFDVHMTLQVPMLSSTNGMPLHVTQIYNTTDSEGGWRAIARQFLGENSTLGKGGDGKDGGGEGGVISGRSYPRRFDSGLVSVETQRRICFLVLIDYCCLNLPLPAVCKGRHYKSADDDVNRQLFCILDRMGRIQPGMFPRKSQG
ncbi:hypothetical protein ACHAXA_000066 [Cyclostephanos tholiformis]|uniref:Uncharacterized protein n=1 Tax=Cyclostephanos tholiformis TaxID=382380 RepID=A0ABD3SRZ1_9STRA